MDSKSGSISQAYSFPQPLSSPVNFLHPVSLCPRFTDYFPTAVSTFSIQLPDSIRQRVEVLARDDGLCVDAYVAKVLCQRIALDVAVPHIPETIYRYQAFNEQTLSSLCSDQLYFSRAEKFNDPFDCNPCLEADSDLQSLKDVLKCLLKRRISSQVDESLKQARIRGSKAVTHADTVASNEVNKTLCEIAYYATDQDGCPEENELWLITRQIESELRQDYDRGVCCFSSTNLHSLLWSHYGDSHKGLCIGYTLDRNPSPDLQKVVYGGCRSIKTSTVVNALLHNDSAARKILDRDFLLRKADCWTYEDEWRLIGKAGLQVSPLKLKNITFGLQCPEVVQHITVKSLAGRADEIQFYKVNSDDGAFSLSRALVDLEDLGHSFPKTAESFEEMDIPLD